MSSISAGMLMYRVLSGRIEVLLVHPGGPFWQNKDQGAWTIPKGEPTDGEQPLETAKREFEEEIGIEATGDFLMLTPVKQRGGKAVHAWAFEGNLEPGFTSNTFTMEWPPSSGRQVEFPEIDKAEFFDLATAKQKINPAQAAFITEVEALISRRRSD